MQALSSLKGKLYSFYKEHLSESKLFVNLGHLWTLRISPMLCGKTACRYHSPSWRNGAAPCKPLSQYRLAVICDDMTWSSFQGECELVQLTPDGWRDQLEAFRPDAFVCESAWEGLRESGSPWRWRIYRNHDLWFENRRELLDVLHYCSDAAIPTIFWNKEDPPSFDGQKYDFVDTALKFDHIFTTAEECKRLYTDAGHASVHTLMFGFSPRIFHPLPYVQQDRAVFHGSWYAIHTRRCEDMRQVFDMLLDADIPLTIYDRQSESGNPLAAFPEKYRPYVRRSVHYEQIRSTLEGQSYAVNINTVTGSTTMFARRVFEMMACGLIVISNPSVGIEQMFGERVWFAGRGFDISRRREIRRQNIVDVFLHHTWRQRLTKMLSAAGFELCGDGADIAVVYRSGSAEKCREHFSALGLNGASGWLLTGEKCISLENMSELTPDQLAENCRYFFTAAVDKPFDELDFMTALTCFTDTDAAVAVENGEFEYARRTAGDNWLIPSPWLEAWVQQPELELNAYLI